MSYGKYAWQEFAGDFNSPMLRNYILVSACFKLPTLLSVSSPGIGIFSRRNRVHYVADMSNWAKAHEELKQKALADPHYVEWLIDQSIERGEAMNTWTDQHIFNANLAKLTGKELYGLFAKFSELQQTEYAFGMTLPILDFLGFSFVERNLEVFLKSKVLPDKYPPYYEVFTAPIHNSFAQDQEEDLLKIMAEFLSGSWADDVQSESLEELTKSYPAFVAKLKKHAHKHGWVYYVFIGPAFTEQHFLDFIKDYLAKGINPNARLQEIAEQKKHIAALKEQYLNELKPDAFHKSILELAGKMVWAKPRRKDYQSKSYYHVEKLMREIAKRLNITLDQARAATPQMLEQALTTGTIDAAKLNELYDAQFCLPNDDGTITVLAGKDAIIFYEKHVAVEEAKAASATELKGMCACKGTARGIVKIINQPADMGKMQQGDVLVSLATSPGIVPAMKKAAAIVTDEGGLTCHAAIVSRELNIPCVVGLKTATKTFKDGDNVEVDATKGIIKKIK